MKERLALGLVGVCFFWSGCATMNSGQPGTGQDSELRAAGVEWDRLYNTADAQRLAALYAQDAVSMPPNLPTLKGRTALEADFREFFAANTARHQTMVDEIVTDGDLAIERAHYRLTYRPKAGGAEVVETGRHVECRRKIGGVWKIVIEIWNVEGGVK